MLIVVFSPAISPHKRIKGYLFRLTASSPPTQQYAMPHHSSASFIHRKNCIPSCYFHFTHNSHLSHNSPICNEWPKSLSKALAPTFKGLIKMILAKSHNQYNWVFKGGLSPRPILALESGRSSLQFILILKQSMQCYDKVNRNINMIRSLTQINIFLKFEFFIL